MLRKATHLEMERYMDFAYELAIDPKHSGYPVYFDGIKTKEDFVKNTWRSYWETNRDVLLFIHEGRVEGLIRFFILEKDRYLQTDGIYTAAHTRKALEEFTEYCRIHYAGYSLYLGFPAENEDATAYLAEAGWSCQEHSYNYVMHLAEYSLREEHTGIRQVTRENFGDFEKLHSKIEADLYWNCQRLYEDLDRWNIYLYDRDGVPTGTIFYTDGEIFGLNFFDGIFNHEIYDALLTRALNDHKRRGLKHIVFFQEEEGRTAASELGFNCVGAYLLFVKGI